MVACDLVSGLSPVRGVMDMVSKKKILALLYRFSHVALVVVVLMMDCDQLGPG